VDTVRLWRDRWAGLQGIDLETLSVAERLQDAPRPGASPKFTYEYVEKAVRGYIMDGLFNILVDVCLASQSL
jgi:hypothetical protein